MLPGEVKRVGQTYADLFIFAALFHPLEASEFRTPDKASAAVFTESLKAQDFESFTIVIFHCPTRRMSIQNTKNA